MQLARQPAKKVEEYVVILNEMDRQTEEEMKKAKGGVPGRVC